MMRLISLLLTLFLPWMAFSQKNVTLSIQHGIQGEPFEFGKVWPHPYGAFSVFRMQFYLSDIVLIHDGGQHKALKSLYLLVNADQTDYDLGEVEVGQIEGIRFHIGVDSSTNHADPALWPADHPLAYQEPSMHWGWTSGYRFMAFEGLFDFNKNGDPEKVWEFHAVGDALLTPVTISVPPIVDGKNIRLEVKADYDRLFNNGVHIDNILHGDGTLVREMMENFVKGPVFHSAALVSSTSSSFASDLAVSILGNPSTGFARVQVNMEDGMEGRITVFDLLGNPVFQTSAPVRNGNSLETTRLVAGQYLLRLQTAEGHSVFRSLVVVE